MPFRRDPGHGLEPDLDYETVRSYWEEAAEAADFAAYMAHEQGMPRSCVEHRLALEQAVVDRWFASLGPAAAVLDVGCGAGTWTELFARRYAWVVGVEASGGMLAAARRRLTGRDNVELIEGDARTATLEGEFEGVFVGGLLMYLDRGDAVALLARLGRSAPAGRIILRESGVRRGVEVRSGAYPVVYRSPQEYEAIAADAGLRVVAIERNRGYAHMEVGIELVTLARRRLRLGRHDPAAVGAAVWRFLEATAPVSLELVPRAIDAVGLPWPHLINHFVLLEASARVPIDG